MDLSRKSKSFMISDILTEPLNLSSTCRGDSNEKSSCSNKQPSSLTNGYRVEVNMNGTGQPSRDDISRGAHSKTSPTVQTMGVQMTGFPNLAPQFGPRQLQFCSPTLVPNCIFPSAKSFPESHPLDIVPFRESLPSSSSNTDIKHLACFCSLPFCTGSSHLRGFSGAEPLGFGPDPSPVTIPLPLYVRTRFANAAELLKAKRCRRSRTVFTELQLMGLENRFESQKYLSTPDRVELADRLGLSQIQVKTWYQNRRMKWKKQVLQEGGTEPPTKPKGRPKKSFLAAAASGAHASVPATEDTSAVQKSECDAGKSAESDVEIYIEGDGDTDEEIEDI